MANRNKNFNALVAKEFNDLSFAQSYITHLINSENLSLEEALRESIKSMGLQAFATRAGVSISYVSDFVHGRRQWSTDSLIKHTEHVFKLKAKILLDAS